MAQDNQNNNSDNTEQLRAQAAALLAQARSQLNDLQRALGSLGGDSAMQARLASAAAQLSGITSELSQALGSSSFPLRAADLMTLAGVVQSSETNSLLAEAASQGTMNVSAAAEVAAASADTRAETQDLAYDVFDEKIFDPYLRFSSPEDEEAFRKREAEAKKYVADQLARKTPEGDLNAGGGMIGTMLDAQAHGAGNSPEFMPRWNALVQKTERQRAAMQAAGQSTAEFDQNLTTSVRSYLKAKGLSDPEIDNRLAAAANPLDVVQPYLKDDSDSRSLESKVERASPLAVTPQSLPRVESTNVVPPSPIESAINLNAAAANLKAAGVQMSDVGDADPTHGLTIQKPAKPGLSVGG